MALKAGNSAYTDAINPGASASLYPQQNASGSLPAPFAGEKAWYLSDGGPNPSDAPVPVTDYMPPHLMHGADEHIGFKKLESELAHKKGVEDPAAVAGAIGEKKYGAKEMAAKAAAGKDEAEDTALWGK